LDVTVSTGLMIYFHGPKDSLFLQRRGKTSKESQREIIGGYRTESDENIVPGRVQEREREQRVQAFEHHPIRPIL
jgi:hypothetical protein